MNPRAPAPPEIDLASVRARLNGQRGPEYWRSLEEIASTKAFREFVHREFPAGASEWVDGLSRRDFLGLMGASLGLAGLTACTKQPIERIVPYVTQPEEMVPGKPLFFATAMSLGGFATGLLVESHEGHPTKVEGNPGHPMSLGATNIFHQAALLDLYDPDRSQAVLNGGQISSWAAFLSALNDALRVQQPKQGAGLRILTETVTSPTLFEQIQSLLRKLPKARWHQFDPLNRDNVREGSRLAFGEVVETHHYFAEAKVILALESDFLVSHPASLRYAREFVGRRRVSEGKRDMNRLYVVESTPSVTGSNADHRLPLRSCDVEDFARAVAQALGAAGPDAGAAVASDRKWISAVAADLQKAGTASLVIVGDQQPTIVHALAHSMNHRLGNIGVTVTYAAPAEAGPANQVESLRQLSEEMKRGEVEMLVLVGGNPAYNAPADFDFAQHMSKAKLRIHLSPEVNETSALCQWHIPEKHFLESWSDARAFDGTVSLIQPLILPLYAGQSAHELLDAIGQPPGRTDYDIVRDYWRGQIPGPDFEKGWRRALHDGVVAGTALPAKKVSLQAMKFPARQGADSAKLEISFQADPTIGDGRFANNGWLQELAKPLSKLTWDNAALVSPTLAQQQGLANGDVVELDLENRKVRGPIWIMPGQAEKSVTLYLGHGRTQVGRVGRGAGFDAYPLRASDVPWFGVGARMNKTGERHLLVSTQTHYTIDSEERQIFRELTLGQFLKNPSTVRQTTEAPGVNETLFNPEEHHYDGYHWGLSIDLTACLGCNACILACQAENNIPVVGKAQVAVRRAMQWIRVDTYFQGELDNPEMNHQPVPCMHCENAPCELVCPVGATLHDKEGLNLQVYNRCIGTRYCSNNCPYKVRRFNFFQYADYHTPSLKPMWNPNVSVRWRGVMEKCTYCIQRISAARITAKEQDRKIRDGEIETACQQACPTEAIVFGDISDPKSRVAKLKALELDYAMLGELNTRPRTTYLAKVRNPNPELEPARAGQSNLASAKPGRSAQEPERKTGAKLKEQGSPPAEVSRA